MSDREAFEKQYTVPDDAVYNDGLDQYSWRGHPRSAHPIDDQYEGFCAGWQAAQAQAGQPIAAVHGWFHGECVIRPLDPEAVLRAGMALYSHPQAQAGDGEAVGWQYQHEDTGRTTFVSHAEASEFEELNSRRWHKTIPLYTAPSAAKINITANEWAIDVLTEAKEIFEAQADDIDPSLMDVAHRCFCAINGLQQAAAVNRQDLIDLLIATRTQSEGVTADLIIRMIGAKPAVNQQLLELETYDAGYLNDFGGGNVSWWHDYIRSELGRAHDFYSSQIAAAQEQK